MDALGYPLRGDHRVDAVVAAWILLLAHGVLPVVPLVPLVGILVAGLEGSARRLEGPPSVTDDPVGLVRDGLGGSLVVLAYAGLPLAYLLGMVRVV